MGKVTGAEAKRAWGYRKKQKEGKPLKPAEKVWLADYTKRTQRTFEAPPQLPAHEELKKTLDDAGYETVDVQTTLPGMGQGGGAPPALSVPLDPGAASTDDATRASSPTDDARRSSTTGQAKTKASEPTDEEKARGRAIAEIYVAYVRKCNEELKSTPGAFPLPDLVIDGLISPCAHELATRHLGAVELGDTEMGLVVIAGGAATIGQLYVFKDGGKKRKQREERPIIDVTPPPTEAQRPPRAATREGPRDERFTGGPWSEIK